MSGGTLMRWVLVLVCLLFSSAADRAAGLNYTVFWVGNSFSGASNKWVQNFFINMNTRPDGACYTWSHWDEGGKKFGVYKDGDVIGNTNIHPNSLEVRDKSGRTWRILVEYVDPKNN